MTSTLKFVLIVPIILQLVSSRGDPLGVFKPEPIVVKSYAIEDGYRRHSDADERNS